MIELKRWEQTMLENNRKRRARRQWLQDALAFLVAFCAVLLVLFVVSLKAQADCGDHGHRCGVCEIEGRAL